MISLHDRYHIIASIATAFLFAALAVVLLLFFRRVTKTEREKLTLQIREKCQGIFNALVVHETFSDRTAPQASFQFHLEQVRLLIGNANFKKDLVIQLLLEMKKNFSGSSALIIFRIYEALELHKRSLQKLRSFQWELKAMGIRELGEMDQKESIYEISRFIRSRNEVLRQESVMSLVRLNAQLSFSFLDEFEEHITDWMQLNIYAYLQGMPTKQLPEFSKWFSHRNTSVRLFAINMAKQFRQTQSLPLLAGLIDDKSEKIATAAITALGEMEAFDQAPRIAQVLPYSSGEKLIAGIECLGKIGDPESAINALIPLLAHANYEVRFAAARAMKKLGNAGNDKLIELTPRLNLESMIAHLEEPLLR